MPSENNKKITLQKKKSSDPGVEKEKKKVRKTSDRSAAKKNAPIEKTVQSDGSGELVIERRKANESSVKWLKIEAISSVVVCTILLFIAIGVVSSKAKEVFFYFDSDGRYKQMTPIYEPKHSNAFVGDWLHNCLVDTFDFSYANYSRELGQAVNNCYSKEGASSLERALVRSGNLDAVRNKRLYITMALDSTPIVIREMRPDAQSEPYRWALQSRGVISLRSQTSDTPNKVSITAVVSRASEEDTPEGLAIDRLIIN